MRTLAIGDIHGHAEVLCQLLEEVGPQADDVLIAMGDYVDRGPDSRGVLDMLIPFHRAGWLVALRGNHDVMMCAARAGEMPLEDWLRYGGRETLLSYGLDPDDPDFDAIPQAHWDFLENKLVDWHETKSHFFVHARAHSDLPLSEQPTYLLHWEPLLEDPLPHISGKTMICGHTRQVTGVPRNWGHAACIDTWVYGEGWLTCLDVEAGDYWQVNRKGERRKGNIAAG